MIKLEEASRIYNDEKKSVKAVDNVNLELKVNEFILVTGRSGSGKTTLLSLIGGLIKPTSGKVFFEDIDIWKLSDRKLSELRNKRIGFIFQFASLLSTLSVRENLRVPTMFHSADFDVDKRSKDLLHSVGLLNRIDAFPSKLSGGEQRRVALARSLMNNPDILLADEPTGDLDEETETEMMEILCSLNKEGKTIVMVTHNTGLIKYSSRHLRMSQGKIIS